MVYADTPASQDAYNRYYAAQSSYQSPAGTGSATPVWDLERLAAAAKAIGRAVENAGKSKDVTICDIGCANGGLLEALRREGFSNLTGIDPSAICVANTQDLGFRAKVGDLSNLPGDNGEFDVVVLTAVMEHVLDVRGATAAVARVCAADGIVFLEVPDAVEYENFLHAPFQDFNTEHINHFSRAALRNLMRQFGFTVVLEESHTLPGAGGLRMASLFTGYANTGASVAEDWEHNESFRESIERYILASSIFLSSLDRQLRETLPAGDVVVYGTGQLAMKLLKETVLGERRITAFVDGNPVKAGQRFGGVPVVLPEDLRETAGGAAPILITTLLHADGIRQRIAGLGLPNPVFSLQVPAASSPASV